MCFLLYGLYQDGEYFMIGLCHHMATDHSDMVVGECPMAGGDCDITRHTCPADGM